MKISKAQQNELVCLAYFNGKNVSDFGTDEVEEYFKWSEKGIGDGGRLSVMKQRRGIFMGEYEQGVLQGITPYWELLGGMDGRRRWWNFARFWKGNFYAIPIPRVAVDFMKKELFKGIDADIIERCYQYILGDSDKG